MGIPPPAPQDPSLIFVEWLKREKGNADITVKMKLKKLKTLKKRTNLWNIQETRIFIQDLKRSDSYKGSFGIPL